MIFVVSQRAVGTYGVCDAEHGAMQYMRPAAGALELFDGSFWMGMHWGG